MPKIFQDNRSYVLGDPELDLLGDRDKLAQWRHKNVGPAFYRLGRKIVYRGADLNAWVQAQRVEPNGPERIERYLEVSLSQRRTTKRPAR